MRLNLNLAQIEHKKRPVSYWTYLPLLLIFLITLAGNYLWYRSVSADIARYDDKLSKIGERASMPKDTADESISQKEKDALLKEAGFINAVIKGRTLSWSGLVTRLEKEHIPNISMVSLTPRVVEDKVKIAVRAVGKDLDTITRFMDRLERSPSFQAVFLSHSSETDLNGEKLVNFSMELEYTGR